MMCCQQLRRPAFDLKNKYWGLLCVGSDSFRSCGVTDLNFVICTCLWVCAMRANSTLSRKLDNEKLVKRMRTVGSKCSKQKFPRPFSIHWTHLNWKYDARCGSAHSLSQQYSLHNHNKMCFRHFTYIS